VLDRPITLFKVLRALRIKESAHKHICKLTRSGSALMAVFITVVTKFIKVFMVRI
jgi:hypothetical protein